MSINPLNDISKVYLEQVAAVEEGVRPGNIEKPLDKAAFKKRRRSLVGKEKSAEARKRGHEGKEWYNSGRTYSPDEAKRSRAKMDDEERRTRHRSAVDPDNEDDNNYSADRTKNPKKLRKQKAMGELGESAVPGKPAERLGAVTAIPKSEQDAARERILAKTKAKREAMKTEALDPVGQEDADIDNDGDNDKTDKYLHNRRKAIGKAIAKKRGKTVKEGFSNWRQDLSEVMTDEVDEKPIKEKKISNKIKVNPNLSEAVEELGGTLIEMVEVVDFDGVLDDLSESEIFFLNDSLIEEVVEEFFLECLEEGYDLEEVQESLLESLEISSAMLVEAKVTLGHDTKIKSDRLEKVKSAVKKVGGTVARGAGYAAGAAVRGARAVGREFKKGYARGRGGSSSDSGNSSASTSSSSSSSSSSEKRPGLLSRIGSKLKSGLKKAVASGARAVSRGARNVARKMEGGDTKKAEAPKAAPKKAEKPSDPWGEPTTPPKTKPKAATKKAAAPKPKAKAPAKKKKSSKLDDLLASVRNEEVQLDELSVNKMLAYGKAAQKDRDVLNKKWDEKKASHKEKMRVLGHEEGEDRAAEKIKKKTGKYPHQMNTLDRARYAVTKEETQIDEKTLTKMEMKKREEIVKSMKDKASDFEKRYPGRGKEVMYATATKMAKKVAEQMMAEPTTTTDSSIDKKKEMMDRQKIANMKMLQQKQQMLQKQKLQMQKSGKLPLEAD